MAAEVTFEIQGSLINISDVPCTENFQVMQSDGDCVDIVGMTAWCQVDEATGEMQFWSSETNVYLIVCGVFFVVFVFSWVGVFVYILKNLKNWTWVNEKVKAMLHFSGFPSSH